MVGQEDVSLGEEEEAFVPFLTLFLCCCGREEEVVGLSVCPSETDVNVNVVLLL